MTTGLPKYIQNANRIIDILAEQQDKTWKGTQRELCAQLGLSQPELSNLISVLAEAGKIRKGNPLPGIRGRNYSIELVDAAPLTAALPRRARNHDRALQPGEAVTGPVDLQTLTLDQVGAAVLRTMQQTWEKAERAANNQSEHMTRIREMREQLNEERQYRIRFATDKEKLEKQLEAKDAEIARMRGEINNLIVRVNSRRDGNGGSVPIKDLLGEDELRLLANLMKDKPGFYRESDEEVGLKVS